MAIRHLQHASKEDLVILDRGYPSLFLFRSFLNNGIDFCCRLTIKNWKVAQELVGSDKHEDIVEMAIPKHLKKKFYTKGLDTSVMKLRLIRVKLKTGEDEILITSLLDNRVYPHSSFKKLYSLRWGIEESYKVDKHQFRLEDFSGYTVQSIMQEFNAMIWLANIASIFAHVPVQEIQKAKHRYKVNITIAISKTRDSIVTLFKNIGEINLIEKVINTIWSNLIPIREKRNFPRVVYRRRRYHYQYKNL